MNTALKVKITNNDPGKIMHVLVHFMFLSNSTGKVGRKMIGVKAGSVQGVEPGEDKSRETISGTRHTGSEIITNGLIQNM